jgi:hypothetical protein
MLFVFSMFSELPHKFFNLNLGVDSAYSHKNNPMPVAKVRYKGSHHIHPLSKRLRQLNNDQCNGSIMGIYLTTNEMGSEKIAERLKKKPIVMESCHIGFSGMHNFNIMALRHSSYGLICDFNKHNKTFIEKVERILHKVKTREEFVVRLKEYVRRKEKERIDKLGTPGYKQCMNFSLNFNRDTYSIVDELESELKQEGSWLANDADFRYIQDLALRDRIVVLTIDARDSERFEKIAKIYEENAIQIDTLYLSNICGYMADGFDKKAFANTVRVLLKNETSMINCPFSSTSCMSTEASPIQKLYEGSAFKTLDDRYLFFSS